MVSAEDESGQTGVVSPLPPVRKPATLRCLGPVDPGPLVRPMTRLSDQAWEREDRVKRNRFPCFHHTRHFVFRFFRPDEDPRRFHARPGWRLWRAWLLPLMERVAATYGFTEPIFPKAMLARLESGQCIDLHVDGGASTPLVHKVHIPLQTDPRAVMTVGGTTLHLLPGYAWEVNNLARHGAHNGSERDRIHFIFELFEGAGHNVPENEDGGDPG